MPQAFTLGRTSKYVQIALTDRYAPRCEPMHTTEVKGKKRYGEGHLYRVAGRLAVGVGQWTEPPSAERIREIEGLQANEFGPHLVDEAEFRDDGPHLITADQFDELRNRLTDVNRRKMADGWTPPLWHWRRYQEFLLPLLHRLKLVSVTAYGDVHLRRPRWWPFAETVDGWRPMVVAEEMPTVQEDDVDALGA